MEFPYIRLSGIRPWIPPYFSVIQVSSKYLGGGRTLVTRVLSPSQTLHTIQKGKVLYNVPSQLDADWLGLISGVEYAMENGETVIAIEHSNMELMQGLLIPGTLFHRPSIQGYKERLLSMTENIEWLGGRYISVSQNRSINQRLY